MERSDWFTLWKAFHAWYRDTVKTTGHAPTWRRQQNKIHKLVVKAMAYRRVQPPVMGKRPVGRPRKHPKPDLVQPGPGIRSLEGISKEPLPTIKEPGPQN